MKLVEPEMKYKKQIEAFRREYLSYDESMDGSGSLRHFENAKDWIKACKKGKKTAEPGKVTATQYIFIRESDKKVVGLLQFRHYLNDFLLNYGGHIGYCVLPSERRKGYATEMLKAALPECRKAGLDRVLITCLKDNEGSRRTILNNGGVYENTVYEETEFGYLERYWIDL